MFGAWTYWFDVFNSALKSLENLLSLCSTFRVCKCLGAEAVSRGIQIIQQLQQTQQCANLQWKEKMQTEEQVYPPVTDLLDFLSDLISPVGNEKHCPLHHFTLQTKKETVKECDEIPISSLSLSVPGPTVSGCSSRSSISLKSTII